MLDAMHLDYNNVGQYICFGFFLTIWNKILLNRVKPLHDNSCSVDGSIAILKDLTMQERKGFDTGMEMVTLDHYKTTDIDLAI